MQRLVKTNIVKILFASIVVVLWVATAQAASTEFRLSSTYDLKSSGQADVQHVLSYKNIDAPRPPASYTFPIYGGEPTDLAAVFDGGQKLNVQYDSTTESAIVSLPPNISGSKDEWKLSLSYSTDLLRDFGESRIAQIGSLGDLGLNIVRQDIAISADLELGFATTRGLEPTSTDISVGKQVVTYANKKGVIDSSLMLVFGEQSVAEVKVGATLKNSGFWWKDLLFTLPPDTNQQQVLVESISPKPHSVALDQDGNVIVSYRLAPRQTVDVQAQTLVKVSNVSYDLSSAEKVNDIDQDLREQYTTLTENWRKQGLQVTTSEEDSVLDIVSAVHGAVVDEVEGDLKSSSLDITVRSQGLKYADILVGELRSRKIPARVVLGKVFSDGTQLLEKPMNHAWAEAYVPGLGWMTLDPLFASSGDYYGTTDSIHIGLVLWGVADNRPPINLDVFAVSYGDREFQVSDNAPEVTATKYVILPGISILSVAVETPYGAITDSTAVKTVADNAVIPLGSLAPQQMARTRLLRMGGSAFSSEDVEYGLLSGESFSGVATQTSSLSFLVVLYEFGVLALMGGTYALVRRRRKKLDRVSTGRETVQMHTQDEGEEVEEEDLIAGSEIGIDTETDDTLPEVVDPDIQTQNQAGAVNPWNGQAATPEPKNDTIRPQNGSPSGRRKPPHSNLIQ